MIGALLGDLWPYIIAALGTLATLATAWLVGRKAGAAGVKAKRAAQDAEAERATHARINQADTGTGLSDDERVSRLRDFAAKHGTRPPKAGGR
jgi:hypothetical protein